MDSYSIGDLLPFVKASAPGKIILFGEHAAVYGRPALAVPVAQVHADVEVLASTRKGIWIDAPDIGLHTELGTLPPDHPIACAILQVFQLVGISNRPDLTISIVSSIPVAAGLGSGAAVSTALIKALALSLDISLPLEQINQIVYEIEKLHHGTPSGIDNTVITYNRPVFFIKDVSMEPFKAGKPFTVVIGDTGVPALTRESVGDVKRLREANMKHFETLFNEIARLSLAARTAIENGEPFLLGGLMDQNHALLQEMTVSSPELDRLVNAAREAGAHGAKLSGGGRGGNMIALADENKAEHVAQALIAAGAKQSIITQVS